MNTEEIDTFPPQVGDVWQLRGSDGGHWRVIQVIDNDLYKCRRLYTGREMKFIMNDRINRTFWTLIEREL